MRIAISLVIALVGSAVGMLLLWYGGANTVVDVGRYAGGGAGMHPAIAASGCLLLAVAAASVRWSSAGVIAAGSIHLALSLVAVLMAYQPLGGGASPATWMFDALMSVNSGLATGAVYFVSFGGGLLIGAALLSVGLLARRERPSMRWRVLSALGGLLALWAAVWALAAGGDVHRTTFETTQGDTVALTVLVVAALLFGALLAPSGRSSIGAWVAGAVLSLAGLVLLFIDPVAFAGLPSAITATLPAIGWSGTLLAVGTTVLGLALGVTLRPEPVTTAAAADPQEQPPAAV